jgi:arylsulfatase A-like enzyme
MAESRKVYSKEFKVQAVELLNSSEKTGSQIEAELELSTGLIYRWRKALEQDGATAFPGNGNERDKELAELRKENAELRAQDELENAVIVYLADHGDLAGEHGLMLKNFGIYESIHRIPLLFRIPGEQPGRFDRLATTEDVFPTLCRTCGSTKSESVGDRPLQVPPESGRQEDGAAFCDFMRPASGQFLSAVRTRHFRLVVCLDDPSQNQLYDHRIDPGETLNRWEDPDYTAIRRDLLGFGTDCC